MATLELTDNLGDGFEITITADEVSIRDAKAGFTVGLTHEQFRDAAYRVEKFKGFADTIKVDMEV